MDVEKELICRSLEARVSNEFSRDWLDGLIWLTREAQLSQQLFPKFESETDSFIHSKRANLINKLKQRKSAPNLGSASRLGARTLGS